MADSVISVGRCGGCGRMRRLAHDDVCVRCDANLTPALLALSRRLRTDRQFARACFELLHDDPDGQAWFSRCFGAPDEG